MHGRGAGWLQRKTRVSNLDFGVIISAKLLLVVGVLDCARAGRPCSLAEMAIPAFAGVARRHATKLSDFENARFNSILISEVA